MLDHHHTTINVDQVGISCIWHFQAVLSDNDPNTLNLKPGYSTSYWHNGIIASNFVFVSERLMAHQTI